MNLSIDPDKRAVFAGGTSSFLTEVGLGSFFHSFGAIDHVKITRTQRTRLLSVCQNLHGFERRKLRDLTLSLADFHI